MVVDRGGEELVARRLFERAAQPFPQRRIVAVRGERAAQLGEAAVPQRFRRAHDRRVAGAELFGQRGRGEQRRFGPQVDQLLRDPPLGRGELRPTRRDAVGVRIRSNCYRLSPRR